MHDGCNLLNLGLVRTLCVKTDLVFDTAVLGCYRGALYTFEALIGCDYRSVLLGSGRSLCILNITTMTKLIWVLTYTRPETHG